MTDETWVAKTIEAKSDQLNAEDLITGPIEVTVTGFKEGPADQPWIMSIDGDRQPYKPCKSMRKLIVKVWGKRVADWIGGRLRLYCDPEVTWGKQKVGGIRISAMSGIESRRVVTVKASRGKWADYTIDPLQGGPGPHAKLVAAFDARGVSLADIEAYIGHPIGEATLQEIEALTNIGKAIAAGETTWKEATGVMKYSYSDNGEQYHELLDSPEEAAAEGFAACNCDVIWVGEVVPPPQPEEMFCESLIEWWLERCDDIDEYSGEWAEGWDRSTAKQHTELVKALRPVLSAWLDRNDLRPRFWNIGRTWEFELVDGKPQVRTRA